MGRNGDRLDLMRTTSKFVRLSVFTLASCANRIAMNEPSAQEDNQTALIHVLRSRKGKCSQAGGCGKRLPFGRIPLAPHRQESPALRHQSVGIARPAVDPRYVEHRRDGEH